MSVNYKPIRRKNISDPTAPDKYYVILIKKGITDLDKLADLLGKGATMRRADVYAVLEGLVEEIEYELSEGRTVQLGSLGSFSLSVSSEGVLEEKSVSAKLITKRKILYRPGKRLKTMLSGLKFYKI